MGAELELRDDAEVAAAAAQRPEQVGMIVGGGVDPGAVGKDDVGPDEVVDRQPHAARQVPEPAAEREPADAGRGDDPRGHDDAVLGGRAVDLAPRGAAADTHGVRTRVDDDVVHVGQVDDDSVVDDAQPGTVVAAATHRERGVMGPGERDRAADVVGTGATDEQGGMAVDHPVVNGARLVIAGVARARQAITEFGELAPR